MSKIHILVDARMADWSGVGRYETGLIRTLDAREDVALTALVTQSSRSTLEEKGKLSNTHFVETESHPFTPEGTRELTQHYQSIGADLMHCLQYCVPSKALPDCPLVVTIHDLIPLIVTDTMSNPLKRWIYRWKNRHALRTASQVIVPSRSTADDIKMLFPQARVPVTVIPEASDDFGTEPIVEPSTDFPYLLAMGNTRPHKNLELLVDMIARLHNKYTNLKLLLVGIEDTSWLFDQYKRYPELKDTIRFTGPIDDAELRGFYARALIFLCPSYYEGFGLPPLEAAAFGIPILAARAASLPEVVGAGGSLLNAHDVDAWLNESRRVLEDADYAGELRERAFTRSSQFSWVYVAEATVEVYKHVLSATL